MSGSAWINSLNKQEIRTLLEKEIAYPYNFKVFNNEKYCWGRFTFATALQE